MKKLTLLLMLMVASVSFGQLKKVDVSKEAESEIGKIQPMGTPLMMKLNKAGENVYIFTYRDAAFQTMDEYKKFVLVDTGSDLETLYQMIVEGFTTKPKDPIVLELKDQFLYLSFDGKTMRFHSSSDKKNESTSSSAPFNKKQIDKLFGKAK
jgi:hypothetical protein